MSSKDLAPNVVSFRWCSDLAPNSVSFRWYFYISSIIETAMEPCCYENETHYKNKYYHLLQFTDKLQLIARRISGLVCIYIYIYIYIYVTILTRRLTFFRNTICHGCYCYVLFLDDIPLKDGCLVNHY